MNEMRVHFYCTLSSIRSYLLLSIDSENIIARYFYCFFLLPPAVVLYHPGAGRCRRRQHGGLPSRQSHRRPAAAAVSGVAGLRLVPERRPVAPESGEQGEIALRR